nr:MAG TPA: hypothetical protein [Caudoviricetes sp.]
MLLLIACNVLLHQHFQFAVDGAEVVVGYKAKLFQRYAVSAQGKFGEIGWHGHTSLVKIICINRYAPVFTLVALYILPENINSLLVIGTVVLLRNVSEFEIQIIFHAHAAQRKQGRHKDSPF